MIRLASWRRRKRTALCPLVLEPQSVADGSSPAVRGLWLKAVAQGTLERAHHLQRGPRPPGMQARPQCGLAVSWQLLGSRRVRGQNYRNETTEVTELGPHHMRKRTLRSQRKKEARHTNADPKRSSFAYLRLVRVAAECLQESTVYHGERARYHYFQCLQLILRMQVAALTRLWQLPPEFEVSRGLYA